MPSTLLKKPAGMAELHAQIAELTLEKAAYAGRASCKRRAAWHFAIQRIAHLQYAMCQKTRHLPYDAVRISICHAARQLSCHLALLGLAERA